MQYLIAEVFIFSEAQADHLKIKLTSMLKGESYKSLAYQFRVGKSTIGEIIPETCQAIYEVLKDKYFQVNAKIVRPIQFPLFRNKLQHIDGECVNFNTTVSVLHLYGT